MKANGVFDFSWQTMVIDGDGYLHGGEVLEFGTGVPA
jgi:hypothetical protein